MKSITINIAPMGRFFKPNRAMIFIFQGGRDLEEYREEFINASHLAVCNDIMLTEGFWIGLDYKIRLVMPQGNYCWTQAEYISFAL